MLNFFIKYKMNDKINPAEFSSEFSHEMIDIPSIENSEADENSDVEDEVSLLVDLILVLPIDYKDLKFNNRQINFTPTFPFTYINSEIRFSTSYNKFHYLSNVIKKGSFVADNSLRLFYNSFEPFLREFYSPSFSSTSFQFHRSSNERHLDSLSRLLCPPGSICAVSRITNDNGFDLLIALYGKNNLDAFENRLRQLQHLLIDDLDNPNPEFCDFLSFDIETGQPIDSPHWIAFGIIYEKYRENNDQSINPLIHDFLKIYYDPELKYYLIHKKPIIIRHKDVHCEIQIATSQHYLDHLKPDHIPYIGVSRLSCILCSWFLKKNFGRIPTRGGHCLLYTSKYPLDWTPKDSSTPKFQKHYVTYLQTISKMPPYIFEIFKSSENEIQFKSLLCKNQPSVSMKPQKSMSQPKFPKLWKTKLKRIELYINTSIIETLFCLPLSNIPPHGPVYEDVKFPSAFLQFLAVTYSKCLEGKFQYQQLFVYQLDKQTVFMLISNNPLTVNVRGLMFGIPKKYRDHIKPTVDQLPNIELFSNHLPEIRALGCFPIPFCKCYPQSTLKSKIAHSCNSNQGKLNSNTRYFIDDTYLGSYSSSSSISSTSQNSIDPCSSDDTKRNEREHTFWINPLIRGNVDQYSYNKILINKTVNRDKSIFNKNFVS